MNFFGRTEEIEVLRKARARSLSNASFTIVTGRRRVGKTELIDRALNDGAGDYVYLLISRQAEKPLCAALQSEVLRVLGHRISIYGTATRLIDIVREVFKASIEKPLTLVIDEFQEIERIDSAFFSELQALWDSMHKTAKINLVVSGSIYRLMVKIFFDRHEPLYGRCTGRIHLEPFYPSVLKDILGEHNPNYAKEDLLALWTITGGVARYVELFMDDKAFTRRKMINAFFSASTTFIDEGRNVLSEEFGQENAVYFSILAAVAGGKTRFSEIESMVGLDVGTYLGNLERHYGLLRKVLPMFAKPNAKNAAYGIDDCFFRFWFRFVFKNQHLIALRQYDVLKQLVERDFDVFSGRALEDYFRAKFIEDQKYSRIGGWWDRKGENEIDLVCENELSNVLDIYEVKRDPRRIDMDLLKKKSEAFLEKNPLLKSRKLSYSGLSMEDM